MVELQSGFQSSNGLLVAQRQDRLEPGGAAGREVAGQGRNRAQQEWDRAENQRVRGGDSEQQAAQEPAEGQGGSQAGTGQAGVLDQRVLLGRGRLRAGAGDH